MIGKEILNRKYLNRWRRQKTFFATTEVGIASNAAGTVVGLVPYVGQVVGPVIPIVTGALADETDWKESFSRAIDDQTHRAIAENDVRNMEAAMQTISSNIGFLKDVSDFTSESVTSIIHSIHDDLDRLVNTFGHSSAIFRQYPLLGIKPLFAMASLIAVYKPMMNLLVPALAKRSTLSCEFKDVLFEYRPLAATDRLRKLEVVHSISDEPSRRDITRAVTNVSERPYNKDGYSTNTDEYAKGKVRCLKGCDFGCSSGHFCFKDLLNPNQDEYFAAYGWELEGPCVVDYMELLRYRVERAFDDPVYLATKVCGKKDED